MVNGIRNKKSCLLTAFFSFDTYTLVFYLNSTICHVNVDRPNREWVRNKLYSASGLLLPHLHSTQFLIPESQAERVQILCRTMVASAIPKLMIDNTCIEILNKVNTQVHFEPCKAHGIHKMIHPLTEIVFTRTGSIGVHTHFVAIPSAQQLRKPLLKCLFLTGQSLLIADSNTC